MNVHFLVTLGTACPSVILHTFSDPAPATVPKQKSTSGFSGVSLAPAVDLGCVISPRKGTVDISHYQLDIEGVSCPKSSGQPGLLSRAGLLGRFS